MKIYIAGKITGLDNYKEIFAEVEAELVEQGHEIMNPAVLPAGFEWDEYMHICFAMIDVCEGVYFITNWEDSPGATKEHYYAAVNGKLLRYDKCPIRPNKVVAPLTTSIFDGNHKHIADIANKFTKNEIINGE